MNYRSDRQRVEAMLIPQMVLGVLICGVNDPNHPDAVAAKQLLVDCVSAWKSDPVFGVIGVQN